MTFAPHPFQRRVAQLLLSGHNVILQAPTGAGKTHAALLPFLHALEHDLDFPQKCLYAVPMRVLANQFVEEYSQSVVQAGRDDRIRVAVQTGERREDRDLTATLTFATIDQVLSSFLFMPYSQPKRQWNINAGAVVASYLVFDEFHLFDPLSTLPTTLEMLRMLKGVAPMLLMTATFSPDMLGELATILDAAIVPSDEAERDQMLRLPGQHDKVRYYHWGPEPLSADPVLAVHEARSIVVCNTIKRAREVFEQLQFHPRRGDIQLLLLHSHFLTQDRQRIEEKLLHHFGKEDDGSGNWIIVATQAIEVGLDISAAHLHTEVAPANAVLQRAGRCARYGGAGHVSVYDVESVLPYLDMEWEIELTRQALQKRDGMRLTFADEQEVVAEVHGTRDRALIQELKATWGMHREEMSFLWRGEADRAAGSRLVRDIKARDLIIHPDPDVLLEHPWRLESFSLYPGTLYQLVQEWVERQIELDLEWGVKWLNEPSDDDGGKQHVERSWELVYSKEDVQGVPLVVVNPALAGYDPERGFLPHEPTGFVSPFALRRKVERYEKRYRLESYEEHVRLVWEALVEDSWPEVARAAARLESRAGWQPGTLERAAHLVAVLHDVGKLNMALQEWYRAWQRAIGEAVPAPGQYIAHTDYDENVRLHVEQDKLLGPRRPPHAVEGAVAVAATVVEALGREHLAPIKSVFTAIARHHGPFSKSFRTFELVSGATKVIEQTLQWSQLLPTSVHRLRIHDEPSTSIDRFFANVENDDELLAYMLLIRALRRADQIGTRKGAREETEHP